MYYSYSDLQKMNFSPIQPQRGSLGNPGRPGGNFPIGTPGNAPGVRPPEFLPERPPTGGLGGRPNIGPNGAPLSPPPANIPRKATTFRVDPSGIRNCLRSFTYVWLNNGNAFWMFPIQVGRTSVTGFRWNPRFGWVFFGISLNRIDAFMCV